MYEKMHKKILLYNYKITAFSLFILFLMTFFLNIQANDVTTFGIKQFQIPRLYMKFFVENENGSKDYIQWQIGAFMIDKIILNIYNIIIKKIGKNEPIEEFERKFNEYKEIKKKLKMKKNMKYGWEEVRQIFSKLISDEYLEDEIVKNFKLIEKWKKIKEIQNWQGMEEEKQNEIIEGNLKLLIKKLHQQKMEEWLVNLEIGNKGKIKYNSSELSKAIQEMNNDSNKKVTQEEEAEMEEKRTKKFESMKMRMRKMVGAEWTFQNLEKTEPILMRFDIIEPTELFRTYKKILSQSAIIEKQQEYINRLGIALIFGEIWKLRKRKPGIIRVSLKELWKLYLSNEISKEGKSMEEKMLEKWVELTTGIINPRNTYAKHAYTAKKSEYWCQILQMNKEQMLKIFDEEKEFKKFLDDNMGSRAKMVRIFGAEWVGSHIEDIFITGNEMTRMLRINDSPNEKHIDEMLVANYLLAFRTENEILREKAATRIFILIEMKHLGEQFGNEGGDLEKEWTEKYQSIFLFYLDQTLDSGAEWKLCENNGIIYRNMLYKLRKFMEEKKWINEDWNFYNELVFDFMRLRRTTGGMMKLDDYRDEKEMLKKDNKKIISNLRAKFPELAEAIDILQFEDEEEIFHFLDTGIRKKKASTMSQAIQDYFTWTSDFLVPCKKYFVENDDEKMEEWKKNLNLDATLWHYKNIFDNLFESIHKKLNIENIPIGDFINTWDYLKQYKAENYQTKKRKLCELQYFIEDSLVKNEDIKKLDEWNNFMTLPRITNIFCHDDQRVNTISLLIVEQQTVEIKKKIYFDYLDWLISNFEEFRQFLMKLDETFKYNIINILNVEKKEGSEKFELLEKLEKKHPKWLKIDEMNLDMRMELFKTVLKTKEYLPESINSQRRIVMATMLREIKKAQNASEKYGLGIKYPEYFEMIKRKIDKLLEEIYEKRGEQFDSMENICILTQFKQLLHMRMEYIGGEKFYCLEHNGKENSIKEYKGDLCKYESMQNIAWENQKKLLGEQHQNFIIVMNIMDKDEMKKLIEKFGGIIRLWSLMPYSVESPLLPEKDFSMDSILREHFLEALYAQNEEDRVANKLAVNFFSWARYIDRKLENMKKLEKSEGTNPTILAQIWQKKEIRFDLINKYDALGNSKLHSLNSRKIYLARFHLDILEVIEKAEKEVFTKENFEEILNQILEEWKYEKHDKKWEKNKEKKYGKYLKRIHKFNRDELIRQIKGNILLRNEESGARQHFVKKIFEGVKNDEVIKMFTELIGVDGIDKIFNKLKPKDKEQENIQKGKELALAEITTYADENELKTLDDNASKKEESRIEEKKAGITSVDTLEENSENLLSSPKFPSAAEIIPEIGTEFVESSGNDLNSILMNNISQQQQHSTVIHSVDSDLHKGHQKEEETFGKNKQTAESKKISGNLVGSNKENERKIGKRKKMRRNNQKSRQNKKERRARKKAEREENWRKEARKKAKGNKITLKEEMKQINEHLIIGKLVELLKNNGYGEFPDPDKNEENEKRRMASRKKYLNQSEFTILEMMEILAKWNKESRMLVSGSMQLKLNSIDSDINLIVILPYEPNENWTNVFEKNFMGNSETKYVGKKCENGDKISLYCFLSQENKVISLEKIYGQVTLIKTRLKRNIPIDINMALVPKELLSNFPTVYQQQQKLINYTKIKEKMEEIIKKQPNLAQIDELIRNIIICIGKEKIEKEKKENVEKINEKDLEKVELEKNIGAKELRINTVDKRNGMIFTLSGYRANKQIIDLLPNEENYKNFQIAFLTLKLWMKNHFIFGSIFGFFNGTTLGVMLCKLAMELGENASALILLEQFFHKYHKNGDEILEEIHLEFKKNDKIIRNELDWTMEKDSWRGMGWKVITPGFPTQNAAFQIIPPSADRIINAELGNGLKKVEQIRELTDKNKELSAEEIQGVLPKFMSPQKFEDKYSHFMTIVCKYPPHKQNAKRPAFCNFLQFKLRFELPKIDAPQIDYFHIKPERIINEKTCPEQFQLKNEEKLCTIWLAGIKLKDDINVENIELEAAINWKESSRELITKIKEEFYKKLPAEVEDQKNDRQEVKFDAFFRYFPKKDSFKWMPQQKN